MRLHYNFTHYCLPTFLAFIHTIILNYLCFVFYIHLCLGQLRKSNIILHYTFFKLNFLHAENLIYLISKHTWDLSSLHNSCKCYTIARCIKMDKRRSVSYQFSFLFEIFLFTIEALRVKVKYAQKVVGFIERICPFIQDK